MKKNITAFLIISSVLVFGQIKIDNSPKPTMIGKVTAGQISLEKLDNKYTICYDDAKFTRINSIKCFYFMDQNNDLDNLYTLIINGFSNPPFDNINLDLPEDKLELHFEKNLGVVSMKFYHTNKATGTIGHSSYMTKKQINKLFGKNN